MYTYCKASGSDFGTMFFVSQLNTHTKKTTNYNRVNILGVNNDHHAIACQHSCSQGGHFSRKQDYTEAGHICDPCVKL